MQQDAADDRGAGSGGGQAGATPPNRTRNSSVDDKDVPRTDPNLDLTFEGERPAEEPPRSEDG